MLGGVCPDSPTAGVGFAGGWFSGNRPMDVMGRDCLHGEFGTALTGVAMEDHVPRVPQPGGHLL